MGFFSALLGAAVEGQIRYRRVVLLAVEPDADGNYPIAVPGRTVAF